MFGLIATPASVRPWGLLGAVNAAIPDECLEMSPLARRGRSQLGTESCVGFAISGVVHVVAALRGIDILPSPLGVYYVARKRTGGTIVDIGSRPDDACAAVRELGIIPEARWPFDASKVDVEPPWDAIDSALDWQRFALRRIVSAGSYRGADVRRAIVARKPVLLGQAVDEAYLHQHSPWARTGPIVGRHAELAIGYTREGVVLVSSWGDGDRIVTWGQLESDDVTDLWAGEMAA